MPTGSSTLDPKEARTAAPSSPKARPPRSHKLRTRTPPLSCGAISPRRSLPARPSRPTGQGTDSRRRALAAVLLQSSNNSMPIDPSFLPPAASPDDFAVPGDRVPVAPLGETPLPATPNFAHTVVFAILVALAGFFIGLVFQLVLMHLAPHMRESAEQMQTDTLLVIPVEALIYAVAGAASFLLFPFLWRRPFGQGIHWRAYIVRRHTWLLVGIGVGTRVVVQLLANFLPIPNELPIDKFFTHPLGVWLIAIFGVTVAPAFEELAFRGFLLPSLASAWDWVIQRARTPRELLGGPTAQQLREGEWQQQTAVSPSLPSDGANVFDRASDSGDAQQGPSNAQQGGSNAERGSSNA